MSLRFTQYSLKVGPGECTNCRSMSVQPGTNNNRSESRVQYRVPQAIVRDSAWRGISWNSVGRDTKTMPEGTVIRMNWTESKCVIIKVQFINCYEVKDIIERL